MATRATVVAALVMAAGATLVMAACAALVVAALTVARVAAIAGRMTVAVLGAAHLALAAGLDEHEDERAVLADALLDRLPRAAVAVLDAGIIVVAAAGKKARSARQPEGERNPMSIAHDPEVLRPRHLGVRRVVAPP